MKHINKRIVALLLIVFIVTISGCSSGTSVSQDNSTEVSNDAERVYEMRITYAYSDDVPHGKNMLIFKENVEELTGGRVKVTLYANAQLADSSNELTVVKSGAVEAAYTISQVAATVNPIEGIWNLPFMVMQDVGDNRFSLEMNASPVYAEIVKGGAGKAGFKSLGDIPTCSGIILANNVRELKKPADAVGLKLRSTSGEMLNFFFDWIEANDTPISGSEVSIALEQGIIDGMIASIMGVNHSKWYTNYMTYTNFSWSNEPLYVNLDWWNSLPVDLQDIIENQAVPATRQWAADYLAEAEHASIEELGQNGVQLNEWDKADPEFIAFTQEAKDAAIAHATSIWGDDAKTIIDEMERIKDNLGWDY